MTKLVNQECDHLEKKAFDVQVTTGSETGRVVNKSTVGLTDCVCYLVLCKLPESNTDILPKR